MTSIDIRPQLAIFDLDNTLLNGDSDLNWGRFLVDKGIVDATEYHDKNEYFYQQYAAGQLNIDEFLAFALKPLSEHPMEQLLSWREQFMQEYIEPIILSKAEALVEQHREQGHQLLIITATNRFVTEPIAKRFGIDELLASEPELIDGQYTGRVSGIPCFQDGKVKRLQQWLNEKGVNQAETWFYSDSHNDIPLLSKADHPVAVDADEILQNHAVNQNWQQISLRNHKN